MAKKHVFSSILRCEQLPLDSGPVKSSPANTKRTINPLGQTDKWYVILDRGIALEFTTEAAAMKCYAGLRRNGRDCYIQAPTAGKGVIL